MSEKHDDCDGKGALMEHDTYMWLQEEYEKARAVRNRIRWLIQRKQLAGFFIHFALMALVVFLGGFHERLPYTGILSWVLFIVAAVAFYVAGTVFQPDIVDLLSEANIHLGMAIGAQGSETAAGATADARRRVHIWADFERRLCHFDKGWEPLRPFTGEGRSVRLARPPAPPSAPPPPRRAPPPCPPDGEGPTR